MSTQTNDPSTSQSVTMSRTFSMLSDGGDRAVEKAFDRALERIKDLPFHRLDEANEIAHEELRSVHEDADHDKFAEVHDTAVRESFIGQLEHELEDYGSPDALELSIYDFS